MASSMKSEEETSEEAILHMDVEQMPVVPTILTQACLDEEAPVAKRQRLDDIDDTDESIKSLLFSINKAICYRLDSMEHKLTSLQATCSKMGRKLDNLNLTVGRTLARSKKVEKPLCVETNGATIPNNTVVIGIPQEELQQEQSPPQSPPVSRSMGRNVTLITLNTEEDFPNGSWLGDETNVECRVRCCILPTDMLHVMQTSKTPEKCALKLLDYLFDRETQAMSNLSGTGKHGKRQLNPLMIYGLRCHLIKHYGISDIEWHRIRMNIDSKCRTAFRRKQRGLPLTVKAFGYKVPERDMLDESFGGDGLSNSHSSEEGGHIHTHRVHMQIPVDQDQLEHHQQDGRSVLKKVKIDQDGIQLHEGQINITQTGEIQIAMVEELADGRTETTLVLQQNDPSEEHHHSHEEVQEDVSA